MNRAARAGLIGGRRVWTGPSSVGSSRSKPTTSSGVKVRAGYGRRHRVGLLRWPRTVTAPRRPIGRGPRPGPDARSPSHSPRLPHYTHELTRTDTHRFLSHTRGPVYQWDGSGTHTLTHTHGVRRNTFKSNRPSNREKVRDNPYTRTR